MSAPKKLAKGFSLANIALVEIIPQESPDEIMAFTTASSCNMDPYVSEGDENIHRVKNTILALNKTEDILCGFDINLSNNTFIPEAFAIVNGGTLNVDGSGDFQSYSAPVSGVPTAKKLFDLNVYTEEKDTDGRTIQFFRFQFKNCVGKPSAIELDGEDFLVPELVIESRPRVCESPFYIDKLKELPDYEQENICEIEED